MGLAALESLVKDDVFSAQVKQLTDGRGVDLALDLVGGSWFAETIDAMAPHGTVMLVGLVAGASAEVPLRSVLAQAHSHSGHHAAFAHRSKRRSSSRARSSSGCCRVRERAAQARGRRGVSDGGACEPALARLANNDTFGKLVLTW